MQDLSSGEMVPLHPAFLDLVVDSQVPLQNRIGQLNEQLQRAKDEAIANRENQGPIFAVGEELEIRGGKFRVHAISGKRIYLDSIPSK